MYICTYTNSTNTRQFPTPPNVRDYLDELDYSQPLKDLTREVLHASDFEQVSHDLDRVRTRWACITAKSQRRKKTTPDGIKFIINQYSNLIEVKPDYERINPNKPPSRDSEQIETFTKRSRQRLMRKARTINRGKIKIKDGKKDYKPVPYKLPVPYFVTLTYQQNFKDCMHAKEIHLNNFLQVFRRRGEKFAYFWKMEPQKRGAVHFHLALFLPPDYCPLAEIEKDPVLLQEAENLKAKLKRSGKWKFHNKKSLALMVVIQNTWARITKDVDGIKVKYTKFSHKIRTSKRGFKKEDYEGREIKTRCPNPEIKEKRVPTFDHKNYGTNVRICENWKAFIAYMWKYLGEEVPGDPFGRSREIKHSIVPRPGRDGFSRVNGTPARQQLTHTETDIKKTGRFWGFSTNLIFDPVQTGIVSNEDFERLNDFCLRVNDIALREYLEHMKGNKERAREKYGENGKRDPVKLDNALREIERKAERQLRRHAVNKEKIRQGYMLQFELDARNSYEEFRKLKPYSVREFFGKFTQENLVSTQDLITGLFKNSLDSFIPFKKTA